LKRTGWFYLDVFLFISVLLSQETDTSITISNYQYPINLGVPIYIDETGENTYFLDPQNPSYLIDTKINTLQIDGSMGIPLGSYYLPTIIPKTQDLDSIRNFSQIYYRKGDYDYSDLGIGYFVETIDSGHFSYQGFKRSPPRLYQPESSQVQNHLVSYSRYTEKLKLGVDALYHIENYILPMLGNYNRKVESFHGGVNVKYTSDNLYISVDPSFQFTYLNYLNEETNHFTFWNNLYSAFFLMNNINLSFDSYYKLRLSESGGQLSEMPIHVVRSGIEYNNSKLSAMGGIALSNDFSDLIPVGWIRFKLRHYNISVNRTFDITFVPHTYPLLDTWGNSVNIVSVGYDHRRLKWKISLNKYDEEYSWIIRGESDLNLSYISLNQKVGFYNIDKNSEIVPVDSYYLANLIFSPNICFWRSGRFQPFFGMESVNIQFSGFNLINPVNLSVFSELVSSSYSSHFMNIEFGFLVKGFKVSYRFINFNLTGAKVNNTINTYPIPPIRHLEVVWQFLN